jgi:hypothetical protein
LTEQAAYDRNAGWLLERRRRLATGARRQLTTEEITARFANGAYGQPQPLVSHSDGQTHPAAWPCSACEQEAGRGR